MAASIGRKEAAACSSLGGGSEGGQVEGCNSCGIFQPPCLGALMNLFTLLPELLWQEGHATALPSACLFTQPIAPDRPGKRSGRALQPIHLILIEAQASSTAPHPTPRGFLAFLLSLPPDLALVL